MSDEILIDIAITESKKLTLESFQDLKVEFEDRNLNIWSDKEEIEPIELFR